MNETEDESAAVALPKLHCLVQRGDTIRADLVATMPAAILAGDQLYYFEVAATADSTAHAIAGALSESRVDAQWQICGGPFGSDWKVVRLGVHFTIRDTRLEVARWKGRLHHVAALDTAGDLILADNDSTLWSKLRARMTCPTLERWGVALVPRIRQSGLLIPANSHGIDPALKAFVLAPDASERFDGIIGNYVREIGSRKQNGFGATRLKGAA